jgi:Mannosyltransferase putative
MQIDLQQLYGAINQIYLRPLPMPLFSKGRSIVTSIYSKELPSGYVLLKELVRLGTALPIEVFYREGELNQDEINLLTAISPEQIIVRQLVSNAQDYTTQYGTNIGWTVKTHALIESKWEENLWLDADSFPIRDPNFLFDDEEYVSKNCLFWRDVFSTDRSNRYHDEAPIWKIFDVAPNDGEPFETGQLLINKPQCWAQVNLLRHYADNCHIYYNFGGDSEAFRMAWQHHTKRYSGYTAYINYHASPSVPYGFMPYGPFHKGAPNEYGKWGGGTVMVQRDRQGRELFNHRNMHKFSLGDNPYYEDIVNEDIYHEHIAQLRAKIGA